jgi:hypothetical protein
MDKWKELHQELEETRWQRFHSRYLVHAANLDRNKELFKIILKGNKKKVKAPGDMFSNCYVLERYLMRDSSNADSVG